jgi:hypothetical protein
MNQTAKWNNDLKIAIINEEIETIARLQGDAPIGVGDIALAKESAALIAEALVFLERKRETLQVEIEQTQKAIAYQRSRVGARIKNYENFS